MMKLNKLTTFNKASIMLVSSICLTSLTIPYAKAETMTKDTGTEMPADADFKNLDVNSDKKISVKEAVKDKTLATHFDMTDMNKDGNIAPDEYASYKAGMKNPNGSTSGNTAPTSAAPVETPSS